MSRINKCVCGYFHDSYDAMSEKFIEIKDKDGDWLNFNEGRYSFEACPECGTLKIAGFNISEKED